MKYRREVDGLRSIAVVPVVLFHGGLSIFSGGFVGVDVFFVISGYLITTIILDKLDDGQFSLLDFYARRARRILPALFLVALCSVPPAFILMLPSEFKDFLQSIVAVTVSSSNFLFWMEADYFAAAAEHKPLLHTWSLAVEEQYYILFPLLLILLWRRSQLGTIGLLALIFVASLGLSEWLSRTAPSANFYLLPTRAWELMAGSLCAVFVRRAGVGYGGAGVSQALSGLGLVLILVSIFAFDGDTPFPSLFALAPVSGAALIILFATQETLTARFLSTRVMVWIGLISYSAYLWHQPLFAFARLATPLDPGLEIMMPLAALSFGLAFLTWKYVETPFRTVSWQPLRVIVFTAATSAALAVAALGMHVLGVQESYRLATLTPQNRVLLQQMDALRSMNHYATDSDGPCRFYIDEFDIAIQEHITTCAAEHGPALVVFGDSHSIDVYKGLLTATDHPFLVGVPQGQCRPHILQTSCGPDSELVAFLTENAVIIERAYYVQAGFWLFTDKNGDSLERQLFMRPDDIEAQLDGGAIERVLQFLKDLSKTVPVTWLGPRLEPHVSFEVMLGTDCESAPKVLNLREGVREAFEVLDAELAQRSAVADLPYVSEQELVAFDPRYDVYDCDAVYWSDGDHWGPAGETSFGVRLWQGLSAR